MSSFLSALMGGTRSPRGTRREPLQLVDLEDRIVLTTPGAVGPAALGLLLTGSQPAAAAALAVQSDGQDGGPLVDKSVDGPFLYAAARGQEQEILLGSLATQIGSFKGVKHFGWRLVGDHALGLAQLVPVLTDAGLSLPGMNAAQRALVADFTTHSGAYFDRAFADFMAQDHEDDIAAFEDEIANGQNPEAVAYAKQNLPVLMKHLRIAQKLQQELGEGGQGPGDGNTPPPSHHSADQEFLLEAARGDQQEIILGAMATKLGSYAGVVAFGHRLVSNHAGALLGIIPILMEQGLNVPRLDPMQRGAVTDFAYRSGDDFDRAFADFMVEDHEEDIARFEDEVHNGTDLLARNYAVQTLPILRDHLRIALRLQQELEGGGSGNSGVSGRGSETATAPDAVRALAQERAPVLADGVSLLNQGVTLRTQSGPVAGASGLATSGAFVSGGAASPFRVLVHFAAPEQVVFGRLGTDSLGLDLTI